VLTVLRPRVIDTEAQLPPLTITHEIVPFRPMQRISYNVIMALITSNVFTSESLVSALC
jgi:hypothetical protein